MLRRPVTEPGLRAGDVWRSFCCSWSRRDWRLPDTLGWSGRRASLSLRAARKGNAEDRPGLQGTCRLAGHCFRVKLTEGEVRNRPLRVPESDLPPTHTRRPVQGMTPLTSWVRPWPGARLSWHRLGRRPSDRRLWELLSGRREGRSRWVWRRRLLPALEPSPWELRASVA